MISKDLILDSNNDLKISGGDFAIDQTDDQNIETILTAEKGQFYSSLLLGYGIYKRLLGPLRRNQEKKDIRQSLRQDNYNTIQLEIDNNFTITVDANKIK